MSDPTSLLSRAGSYLATSLANGVVSLREAQRLHRDFAIKDVLDLSSAKRQGYSRALQPLIAAAVPASSSTTTKSRLQAYLGRLSALSPRPSTDATLRAAAATTAQTWTARKNADAVVDVFAGTVSIPLGRLSEPELFNLARDFYLQRFERNEGKAWDGPRPSPTYYGENRGGYYDLANALLPTQANTPQDTLLQEIQTLALAVGPQEAARNADGSANFDVKIVRGGGHGVTLEGERRDVAFFIIINRVTGQFVGCYLSV